MNFDIGLLKSCFLTIRKLPQCLGNGISETIILKLSSGLQFSPRFQHANLKQLHTALHAAVICLCVKYAYFVCKLRLHFPDSEHLRGFVSQDIFGNFFRHSENFALYTPQLYMLAKALALCDYTLKNRCATKHTKRCYTVFFACT